VRFSAVDEFVEELKKTRINIEPVLRITKVFTQSQTTPLLHVSVEAAVLRDTPPIVQCIKFRHECGSTFTGHKDSTSEETMQRAESLQKEIEAGAAELGLEVRAGLYE
jgi:hypothetical protein